VKVHSLVLALLVVFTTVLSTIASGQEAPSSPSLPPSTPPGIVLVEVLREVSISSDQYLWTRLADANGRSVFYFTGSQEPADEFQPLLAAQGATAFDDWNLIRHEGLMQWTYQSRPLFTWSKEQEPGEVALNVALNGFGNDGAEFGAQTIASDALIPPEGWQVARFTPAESIELADGIDLSLVLSAQGAVLTNFEGFSLYTYDDNSGNPELACTSKACHDKWSPVAAPALAIDVGEFAIVERTDGTRQWSFRGKPLFRYLDDLLPGDVHGRDAHEHLQLALLKENFRPEGVAVEAASAYGDILTLNGMTLYTGSAFEKYWGGRNLRGSFQVTYFKGKRLGGNACVSNECLQSWRPFVPSADATSSGFWEVITREDGSRQWAYKGFALYTHRYDEVPGHMRGHRLYDIADVDGDVEELARTKMLARVGNAAGGAAVYWSVAKP
jgi:predicted lipoprotein with Yx(FWY)xxD motif